MPERNCAAQISDGRERLIISSEKSIFAIFIIAGLRIRNSCSIIQPRTALPHTAPEGRSASRRLRMPAGRRGVENVENSPAGGGKIIVDLPPRIFLQFATGVRSVVAPRMNSPCPAPCAVSPASCVCGVCAPVVVRFLRACALFSFLHGITLFEPDLGDRRI